MWELDYIESWGVKIQCFWTVVLERILSPLDSKEIQQVHSKGNQSWIFIGRTDKTEAPVSWPHDVKSWDIKDCGTGALQSPPNTTQRLQEDVTVAVPAVSCAHPTTLLLPTQEDSAGTMGLICHVIKPRCAGLDTLVGSTTNGCGLLQPWN